MYETSDIRKGLKIELDGEPYTIVDFQFVKPGKGNAFTRTKIRNLINQSVLDRTFKTGEKIKRASKDFCIHSFRKIESQKTERLNGFLIFLVLAFKIYSKGIQEIPIDLI